MVVTTFNYKWYPYHNQNKKDTLYLDTLYILNELDPNPKTLHLLKKLYYKTQNSIIKWTILQTMLKIYVCENLHLYSVQNIKKKIRTHFCE